MALSFPDDSDGEESTCDTGDLSSISELGRSHGKGNSYTLQYFGLENSMDRGAWQATVHGVTKGWTQLSNFHFQVQVQLTFPIMGKKLFPLTKQ